MDGLDDRSKKLLGHIASGIPRTSSWKDELHGKSFPPPRIRQALVPAASRLASPDDFANPKQLLRIDGTPVITHLLNSLCAIGIERVVITLGHAAASVADAVRAEDYGAMRIDFVWCENSWKRGHASNIMAARSMFPDGEPLLLVMSDNLFCPSLLSQIACSVRHFCPSLLPLPVTSRHFTSLSPSLSPSLHVTSARHGSPRT